MSKWNLGFAVLAFAMAPLAVSHASADEVKIGTVDMQKALQSVDAGKKAKAQLEKEFNSKKKDLQNEEAALRKMTDEFKKQSLVMNDEARAKKQGEIQERIMKYQEATQKSQMEIQQKEHELTEPILNKLRGVIGDLAKSKGYSMVLERNENMVLFSPEKDDLTEDVIAAYNKKTSG
jgi:outer membrane protein